MSIQGFTPIPFAVLGGWNTLQGPNDVLVGMSPDLRDVAFVPLTVLTRPGLTKYGFNLGLSGEVNGLHNYFQLDLTPLLVMSMGAFVFVANVETGIAYNLQGLRWGLQQQLAAANLFGRAYIGMGDGKHGLLPPRQLFGRAGSSFEFDRVTMDGPYFDVLTSALDGAAGNIVAGLHKAVVIYETRSGYRTRPTPFPLSWTAAGAKKVDLSLIPIGPSNVVRRIIAFTAAGGSEYYFIAKSTGDGGTILDDNTSTSVTGINFTDAALLSGENVDDLFRLIELPDAAGAVAYSSRMVYWGCRNAMNYSQSQNPDVRLQNLGFDAGFSGNVPLGWGELVAGESKESVPAAGFGLGLKITGDGASAIRGHIRQSTFLSSGLFVPGKSYRVRAWLRKVGDAGNIGRMRIFFNGSSAPGISAQTTPINGASDPILFEARIWDATDAAQNTQLELRVENTPPAIGEYYFDEIIIFPEDEPFQESTFYVSKPEEPEAIDGIHGRLQPRPGDGQAGRCAFVLRNFLYLIKENSIWVTADDGVSDPSEWEVREVSGKVGTPSSRGVGIGDEWAIIAHRTGLWYFDGGALSEEHKLTTEIQPTWDSINWQYGHLIQVQVDTQNKRIFVLVPLGTSTAINRTLVLDYLEGFGNPLLNEGRGRKWCPWYLPVSSITGLQRTSGSVDVVFGNNSPQPPIQGTAYKLDSAALSDDGAAIENYYETAFLQSPGGTRLLFHYLTAQVTGVGTLGLRIFRGNQGDFRDLRGWLLETNGFKSMERMLNEQRERLAVRFGTNAVGENFSLSNLVLWAKGSPWAPVRGKN